MILEGKNLRKTYGFDDNKVDAIKNLSIDIEEGTFVAIVGRSGSGKSTLLHVLGGLVEPNAGEVFLEGQSLYNMNDDTLTRLRRRRMGFVFQFFNLISTQNVLENIVLPIHLDNEQVDNDYIEEVIQLLGLEDKKYAFIHELSGGQQQRVAIARALASKPAIIFADEPTGNLDSVNSHELLMTLKSLNEQDGVTIIMVSHDPMIASYSSRFVYIKDGHIAETLQRQELSQDEYFQKIVDINSLESRKLFEKHHD